LAGITGDCSNRPFHAVGYLTLPREQAYSGLRTVLWIITIEMLWLFSSISSKGKKRKLSQ
jgi:hypothetical protein